MLAIRITGSQLRAGRALVGLSIEDVAARARLSRRSLGKCEGSRDATPSPIKGAVGLANGSASYCRRQLLAKAAIAASRAAS